MKDVLELSREAVRDLGHGQRTEPLRRALSDALDAYENDFMQQALPEEFKALIDHMDIMQPPVTNFATLTGLIAGQQMAVTQLQRELTVLQHDIQAEGRMVALRAKLSDPDTYAPDQFCTESS